MGWAYPMQRFQDWFTQQWAILWGQKIDPEKYSWLMGPFGNLNEVGDDFINQLATRENLLVERDTMSHGLISSIVALNLQESEIARLSQKVIGFYENTSRYNLHFAVQWNPLFKFCGILVNQLFSNRVNQLNIPTKNITDNTSVKSEIITLSDPLSKQVKYTIWLRTIRSTNQVIYSGVYGVCRIPSGTACIKAVFPLPNGNATVIMVPSVGPNGELILDSSGKKHNDAGFYFLLKDAKGKCWSQFIRAFRDRLIVREENGHITAEQTLTLWHQKVLRFNYNIEERK